MTMVKRSTAPWSRRKKGNILQTAICKTGKRSGSYVSLLSLSSSSLRLLKIRCKNTAHLSLWAKCHPSPSPNYGMKFLYPDHEQPILEIFYNIARLMLDASNNVSFPANVSRVSCVLHSFTSFVALFLQCYSLRPLSAAHFFTLY